MAQVGGPLESFSSGTGGVTLADRVEQWLLRAPVAASGAVAGVCADRRTPRFFYGECAGYYLSFLANQRRDNALCSDLVERRAASVQHWLASQWESGLAFTRVHQEMVTDWRNGLVFSFDLAMILRGIASWHEASGHGVWHGEPIASALLDLCDQDGVLLAARKRDALARVPETWSVGAGPFQLKVAAALLSYERVFGGPLGGVAHRLLERLGASSGAKAVFEHPPHPALYAAEGALQAQVSGAATWVVPLVEGLCQRVIDGERDPELWRSDVLAQLIRLRLILGLRRATTDSVLTLLANAVDSDGSVGFRPVPGGDANTWCALFACQAFSWAARGTKAPDPDAII